MLDNKVKEIRLYKNAIIYNRHHEQCFITKKYAEIEFFNKNIIKIDVSSGADITNSDYLEVVEKGKQQKSFFRDNILDVQEGKI